jgi:nitrite reductase/ring-hydroxylating ferredoxin subunit
MAKTKRLLVGNTAEFADGGKKIVANGKGDIGVYFVNGAWHAYQNYCPHQGGPACEGLTMAKVEAIVADDKTVQGKRFDHDQMHIVCPWHGWEFRVADGVSSADRKFSLHKYEVEVDGDEVYVLT